MRTHKKVLATIVLVTATALAGCNQHNENGVPVTLEMMQLQIAPVTSALDSGSGICVFTIPTVSASFKNSPKNALAVSSPYDDIVLQHVLVDYTWDDGVATPGEYFGVPGTVPAGGTQSSTFVIVDQNILSAGGSREGHVAHLGLIFYGQLMDGTQVVSPVYDGGWMFVNSCITPLGGCCTGGGGCAVETKSQCTFTGGAYQGDNSGCIGANCP